jgi:hypothetical protein
MVLTPVLKFIQGVFEGMRDVVKAAITSLAEFFGWTDGAGKTMASLGEKLKKWGWYLGNGFGYALVLVTGLLAGKLVWAIFQATVWLKVKAVEAIGKFITQLKLGSLSMGKMNTIMNGLLGFLGFGSKGKGAKGAASKAGKFSKAIPYIGWLITIGTVLYGIWDTIKEGNKLEKEIYEDGKEKAEGGVNRLSNNTWSKVIGPTPSAFGFMPLLATPTTPSYSTVGSTVTNSEKVPGMNMSKDHPQVYENIKVFVNNQTNVKPVAGESGTTAKVRVTKGNR